jgi:preprotein translocase subunit SecA
MRLFASPRMTALLQRFRPPEGEPISAKVLNKSIETAQKRVEQRNYTMRKHTLEYDDVINKQRQEVYSFRNDLLFTEAPIGIAEELLTAVAGQLADELKSSQWNGAQYAREITTQFPVLLEVSQDAAIMETEAATKIVEAFRQKLRFQRDAILQLRPELQDAEKTQSLLQEVVRSIMVRRTDQLWQEHLLAIDHLRADVHMRTVGQKDPLLEFKHESFALFERLSKRLKQEISRDLFRFEMITQSPQERLKKALEEKMKNKKTLEIPS